jgi:hypothetical protein
LCGSLFSGFVLLELEMPKIYVADNHEQVYPIWQEHKIKGAKLTHLDFHCDMRGIMIDRKASLAFFTSERETTFIDRGNFLAHAIMNGMISDIRWVHGPRGGRAYDVGPVVSYETDTMARLHRYKHKRSGREAVSLKFQQRLLKDWNGLQKNELLDLDWDAFASVEYEATHREALIEAFFAKEFKYIPEITTLIYSPGYSDPDRTLFETFTKQLADKFNAEIIQIEQAPLNTEGESKSKLRKFIKQIAPPQVRTAKLKLSRAWRMYESSADLL